MNNNYLNVTQCKYVKYKYHRVKLQSILRYHQFKGYSLAVKVLNELETNAKGSSNYLLLSV